MSRLPVGLGSRVEGFLVELGTQDVLWACTHVMEPDAERVYVCPVDLVDAGALCVECLVDHRIRVHADPACTVCGAPASEWSGLSVTLADALMLQDLAGVVRPWRGETWLMVPVCGRCKPVAS